MALLALRLSSFTEEVFVIPVEDVIFHVPFIGADDGADPGRTIKIKVNRAVDLAMLPPVIEHVQRQWSESPPLSFVQVLLLEELPAEIFIPPEIAA